MEVSPSSQTSLGIIITNRDRTETLRNCLISLAVQDVSPEWVAISDLGSESENARKLRDMADEFGISYLRVEYGGPWNQALAFNTALRTMPLASHIVQLDADMILHPCLLSFATAVLQQVDAMSCIARYAPYKAVTTGFDGSLQRYNETLRMARYGNSWSLGGFMVFPREWLVKNGGAEESFSRWAFENSDLWRRAVQSLRTYTERLGALVIHQAHARQPGASVYSGNPNWSIYMKRTAERALIANAERHGSFGNANVTSIVLRKGIRAPAGSSRNQ